MNMEPKDPSKLLRNIHFCLGNFWGKTHQPAQRSRCKQTHTGGRIFLDRTGKGCRISRWQCSWNFECCNSITKNVSSLDFSEQLCDLASQVTSRIGRKNPARVQICWFVLVFSTFSKNLCEGKPWMKGPLSKTWRVMMTAIHSSLNLEGMANLWNRGATNSAGSSELKRFVPHLWSIFLSNKKASV